MLREILESRVSEGRKSVSDYLGHQFVEDMMEIIEKIFSKNSNVEVNEFDNTVEINGDRFYLNDVNDLLKIVSLIKKMI